MLLQESSSSVFELISASGEGAPYSALKPHNSQAGQVRFDNVPPGRYLIRVGQFDVDWPPQRVLGEVEVRGGEVTEVSIQLT